jgi:hypothetical protein
VTRLRLRRLLIKAGWVQTSAATYDHVEEDAFTSSCFRKELKEWRWMMSWDQQNYETKSTLSRTKCVGVDGCALTLLESTDTEYRVINAALITQYSHQ